MYSAIFKALHENKTEFHTYELKQTRSYLGGTEDAIRLRYQSCFSGKGSRGHIITHSIIHKEVSFQKPA